LQQRGTELTLCVGLPIHIPERLPVPPFVRFRVGLPSLDQRGYAPPNLVCSLSGLRDRRNLLAHATPSTPPIDTRTTGHRRLGYGPPIPFCDNGFRPS